MKKAVLILVMALGLVLEGLVLFSIHNTRKALASGGDVFHNQVNNLPPGPLIPLIQ